MDVNVIVLIGFLLFMGLSLRFGYRKALHALDKKIDGVRATIDHAEAQMHLATSQYHSEKERQISFEKEAAELLKTRQQEEEALSKAAIDEVKQLLEARQHNADLTFDKMRVETIEQMRKEAALLTLKVVRELATMNLTPAHHEKINDHAITQVDTLLSSFTPINGDSTRAKAVNE